MVNASLPLTRLCIIDLFILERMFYVSLITINTCKKLEIIATKRIYFQD